MRDAYRSRVYTAENRWETLEDLELSSVSEQSAIDILDDLVEAFGTSKVQVRFTGPTARTVGTYQRWNKTITLRHPIRPATVVHEFAHHLAAELWDTSGRGHGGDFVEAYVEAARHVWDSDLADHLKRQFELLDVPTTIEAEKELIVAAKQRAKKIEDRIGETGTVFAVLVWLDPSYKGSSKRPWWIHSQAKRTHDYTTAKVWRTRKTAEKWAEEWRGFRYIVDVQIVEVDAEFKPDPSSWKYNPSPVWVADWRQMKEAERRFAEQHEKP